MRLNLLRVSLKSLILFTHTSRCANNSHVYFLKPFNTLKDLQDCCLFLYLHQLIPNEDNTFKTVSNIIKVLTGLISQVDNKHIWDRSLELNVLTYKYIGWELEPNRARCGYCLSVLGTLFAT